MAHPVSEPRVPAPRAFLIAAAVVVALLAATGALWAHYGTAIFYEMIVAGIALCM